MFSIENYLRFPVQAFWKCFINPRISPYPPTIGSRYLDSGKLSASTV